jgi:DNA helicase II / ATP-dependent DNA helicase PcrA
MRKALENYSLSATHLNEYLRCPVSFYFKYILRVPTAKSEYLAFGTAVHYALEQLARKMLASDKKFPELDVFLKDFERSMYREEESFTEDQFIRRLDYGKNTLTTYYNHYINSWNNVLSPERYFRDVEVNGVPINGKIDKIEFEGNLANVVDYKTGDPRKGQKKLMTLDGDYWRQAVFYRILLEHDKTITWKFASAEIDFIQPDDDGKFYKHRIEVDDLAMGLVKDQIRTAYDGIMNLEFKKACNDKYCDWCNFVKSRYQSVTEGEEVME